MVESMILSIGKLISKDKPRIRLPDVHREFCSVSLFTVILPAQGLWAVRPE